MIPGIRANLFPYGMRIGENRYAEFFNRNYKPCGFNTDNFITFEEFPVRFRLEGWSKSKANKLKSLIGPISDLSGTANYPEDLYGTYYFYGDGNIPFYGRDSQSNHDTQRYMDILNFIGYLHSRGVGLGHAHEGETEENWRSSDPRIKGVKC